MSKISETEFFYGTKDYKSNFTLTYAKSSHHVHKDIIVLHCATLRSLISEPSFKDTTLEIPKVQHCSALGFKEFFFQSVFEFLRINEG